MSCRIILCQRFCSFHRLQFESSCHLKQLAAGHTLISGENGVSSSKQPALRTLSYRLASSSAKDQKKFPKAEKISPDLQKQEAERQLSFDEELAQLTVYQRYKKLFKEYWYVLVPVHLVTSALWFGACYLTVRSGVEINLAPILERLNFPEIVVNPLKNPHVGNIAVALALYKILIILRYPTTVYVTVAAIKYFVRRGVIKPVPSTARLQKMIRNRIKRNRVIKKRGTD